MTAISTLQVGRVIRRPFSGLAKRVGRMSHGAPSAVEDCTDGGHQSSPKRARPVPLSDAVIADRLAEIFLRRPVKVVARLAQTCEGAVKKWRAGYSLPSALALIRLLQHDEIAAEIFDLAGRTPTSLTPDQRKAVAEALKILEGL
ncbi:MAG: hypothetical protein F8N37_12155 [Telmatospirillum sp.]|nr:hypothetical protein [Telmatospirillum sp.]